MVLQHVLSGGLDDGFELAVDGEISRLGSGEDIQALEEIGAVPVVQILGRGRREKTGVKRYGGNGAWEGY